MLADNINVVAKESMSLAYRNNYHPDLIHHNYSVELAAREGLTIGIHD